MTEDGGDESVGPRTGPLSRRRLMKLVGAGTGGVASAAWSLSDVGVPGTSPSDDAAGGPPLTAAASVTDPTGEEWLSIHRADEADRLSPPKDEFRSSASSVGATDAEDTDTMSPVATMTRAPSSPRTDRAGKWTAETTHRLLFEGTALETPLYVIEGPEPGPTGFVVGGMHGDERSGYRAAGIAAEWDVRYGTLAVVPAANPIAIERETRYGANGDLNRKFPADPSRPPTTRLARGLWSVVRDVDPGWLADLHSSRGVYALNGGVGQAVFPTPVPPARKFAGSTVQAVNKAFGLGRNLDYRVGNVLDGDRPMLAHRAGTALNLPAFILETAEIAPLDRQIDWQLFALEHLLRLFNHGPRRSSD